MTSQGRLCRDFVTRSVRAEDRPLRTAGARSRAQQRNGLTMGRPGENSRVTCNLVAPLMVTGVVLCCRGAGFDASAPLVNVPSHTIGTLILVSVPCHEVEIF